MKRVAIVGSEEKYFSPEQRTKAVKEINKIFHSYEWHESGYGKEWCYNYITLISGGCPKGGVDIYAEIVADILGIEKNIFLPDTKDWEDVTIIPGGEVLKGYKSRNMEIAVNCDVLFCIDPKNRKWSGGKWTMYYAEGKGVEVHLIEIE